jgi:cytochrome c55X
MMRSTGFVLSLLLALPALSDDRISGARAGELTNLLIQDCGSCHGLQMKGGLGPALLPRQLTGKSADYLSAVILEGRAGTAMPPWKALLSPAEARWMAERLLKGLTP